MKIIRITKPEPSLRGVIQLPSSKSLSNRLLIMQALSGGSFGIDNLSVAEDTLLLGKILNLIESSSEQHFPIELDCGNAGTDLRFLTAFLAMKPGRWMLTGTDRMKQRPIGELVDKLLQLGASIEYLGNMGFPPLLIKGRELKSECLEINAGVSSQFISALLIIGPYLPQGLTLDLKGDVVSEPYIDMTVKLMRHCGIKLRQWKHKIKVEPGSYSCKQYIVESDWSAASFWYQAAALSGNVEMSFPGLHRKSLQGDSMLASAFTAFGVQSDFTIYSHPLLISFACSLRLRRTPSHHTTNSKTSVQYKKLPLISESFNYDFTHHPDLALPMIATCAAMGISGRFEGLKSLAVKESDRLRSLTTELKKLGCNLNYTIGEFPVLNINPSKLIARPDVIIDTYRDHRMAMTFAMLALKTGSIRIADPDVVAKSYPGFWDDLEKVGFYIK